MLRAGKGRGVAQFLRPFFCLSPSGISQTRRSGQTFPASRRDPRQSVWHYRVRTREAKSDRRQRRISIRRIERNMHLAQRRMIMFFCPIWLRRRTRSLSRQAVVQSLPTPSLAVAPVAASPASQARVSVPAPVSCPAVVQPPASRQNTMLSRVLQRDRSLPMKKTCHYVKGFV